MRASGAFSLMPPVWLWMFVVATVDVESRPPPSRYIATLRGPHFVCTLLRSLPTAPGGASRGPRGRLASVASLVSTVEAKCTPRDGFSRSTGWACGMTDGEANVGIVGEGAEPPNESDRRARDERGGRPSKSKVSIR